MCCIIPLICVTSEPVSSSYIGLPQVKFVFEVFKKLCPGIPLKCMHGRMKHEVQQAIVADFNESTSVLFSTDISSRGLDIQNVDWVVQV
jgi:ATP-dependent RNA helicase DDX10/DBP4